MFTLLKTYSKYFLIWTGFFLLARLVFLLYHFGNTQNMGFFNFIMSFIYGLRLDMSTAGYFSVIPFVLLAIGQLFKKGQKFFVFTTQFFTNILAFISSVLITLDLELYQNWRFRLDDTFIKYMQDGSKEVMASSGSAPYFTLLSIIIGLTIISTLAFKKWVFQDIQNEAHILYTIPSYPLSSKGIKMIFGVILTIALIVPIRGGVQLAPVNQSAVYFSDITFANHAAVNAIWNFMVSCYEKTSNIKHPYVYMQQSEAQNIVKDLFKDSGETEYLIRKDITTPNVIVITWESLTAKAVQHLDAKRKVAFPMWTLSAKKGFFLAKFMRLAIGLLWGCQAY